MGRTAFGILASAVLVCCHGCGGSSCTVSGTVRIDGKPAEKGVIVFAAAEGESASHQGNIVAGSYEVTTTVGKKLVQISVPKIVGKRKEYNGPDAPYVEITQESLPPRFNSASQLTLMVGSGSLAKDWDLTTKK